MRAFVTSAGEALVAVGLALVFFLVLTPVGLVMRALGADLLKLRFDAKLPSYWVDRKPPGPAPASLKDQF